MVYSAERKITIVILTVLSLLVLLSVTALLSIHQLNHPAEEAEALLSVDHLQHKIRCTKTAMIAGNVLAITALLLSGYVYGRQFCPFSHAGDHPSERQEISSRGHWKYVMDHQQLFVSEDLHALMGQKYETQGKNRPQLFFNSISPYPLQEIHRQFRQCLETGETFFTERQASAVGVEKHLQTQARVEMQDGSIVVRGTTYEIEEKKKTEAATTSADNKFATIFRLNPLPSAITRLADGKVLEVNDKALEVFGFSRQEVQHSTTLGLKIWPDPQDRAEMLKKLAEQSPLQFENSYRHKNGKLWNAITSLEIIELEGEKCLLAIIQDITERKQHEQEIKDYSLKLEKLNAGKDRFLSIIAHDLMSPVNGIIGAANILSTHIQKLSREETKTFSATIYSSAQLLKRLLHNLLEWARIQSGDLAFQPVQLNLHTVVDDVVQLLQENAQHKSIHLQNLLPEDFVLEADENMIRSMLRNLVTNAIKFTDKGGKIQIEGKRHTDSLQMLVSDSGVGMSPQVQERIFRIDTKHSTPGTAQEKGTGLGLLLCREFAEKHNGKIEVESQVGKGTTFTVTLPLQAAAP